MSLQPSLGSSQEKEKKKNKNKNKNKRDIYEDRSPKDGSRRNETILSSHGT
jgi:hypothetical protein